MDTFVLKRNDLLPLLQAALKTKEGAVVDLSSATGVNFHMKPGNSTTLKVDAAGDIVSATAGTVKYTWLSGDTDTAGDFEGEFEVTYASTKTETFPVGEYIPIKITPDLA